MFAASIGLLFNYNLKTSLNSTVNGGNFMINQACGGRTPLSPLFQLFSLWWKFCKLCNWHRWLEEMKVTDIRRSDTNTARVDTFAPKGRRDEWTVAGWCQRVWKILTLDTTQSSSLFVSPALPFLWEEQKTRASCWKLRSSSRTLNREK